MEKFLWRQAWGEWGQPIRHIDIDDHLIVLREFGSIWKGLLSPPRRWELKDGDREWLIRETSWTKVQIDPPEPKAGNPWNIERDLFRAKGVVKLGTTPPMEWSGYLADFRLAWVSGGDILTTSEIWRDSELGTGGLFHIQVNLHGLTEYLPLILALAFTCARSQATD